MTLLLQRFRILLVDDHAHMRTIVSTVLKTLGVKEVREASDGGEALRILSEWPADAAIIDYEMAPMNGIAFTRSLRRQDGANAFLPIIMLTGYGDQRRVLEARDSGVTEIIIKPVTAQAVITRLNAVIHNARPFIRTSSYVGPDRRRAANPAYPGPERRGLVV